MEIAKGIAIEGASSGAVAFGKSLNAGDTSSEIVVVEVIPLPGVGITALVLSRVPPTKIWVSATIAKFPPKRERKLLSVRALLAH
jgi:hypothetical protein